MTTTNPGQLSGERLALLYRLSQTFNSSLDLDEVLNRVIDEVIAATRAERGFVVLRDAAGGLVFRAARGLDQTTIDGPGFQVSRSVVERVAREGEPVLASDAQSDERFSMRHSVINLRLRAILCVPLRIKDDIIGVVYVDNRLQAGIFSAGDLELLNAIAASAAVAVENARLYQVAVDKGRLERELQVAREVQAGLLPSETPQVPGWEFVACWRPARTVAGDYYDFIPTEDGRLGLVIADVTDKGMPAALFMTLTRSTVRASVRLAATPADGIAHANRLICADAARGMFVTLAYILLDPGARTLTCVNAGHNPPLHYRAAGDLLDAFPRTGLPLGIDAAVPFTQTASAVEPGDFLVLYTDGVTEADDARLQQFGIERLQAVLRDNCRAPAADIAAALERALDEFTGSAPPHDDVTFVVARCLA